MPKRPRSHILEDLSRSKISEIFSSIGWTVEKLDQDYGEDLLVRIFENGEATPWSFFVQLKATDKIGSYTSSDGQEISYPITVGHAKHWDNFWEPVILIVFDAPSQTSYWGMIQNILKKQKQTQLKNIKKLKIKIPTSNTLDEEGLKRIFLLTKRRFARFQEQKEGSLILIEELKKRWGIDIEYDPHAGSLIFPKGVFIPDEKNEKEIVLFGRLAARIEDLSKEMSLDPETIVSQSISHSCEIVQAFADGGHLLLQDKTAQTIKTWKTQEEFDKEIDQHEELNDY